MISEIVRISTVVLIVIIWLALGWTNRKQPRKYRVLFGLVSGLFCFGYAVSIFL